MMYERRSISIWTTDNKWIRLIVAMILDDLVFHENEIDKEEKSGSNLLKLV